MEEVVVLVVGWGQSMPGSMGGSEGFAIQNLKTTPTAPQFLNPWIYLCCPDLHHPVILIPPFPFCCSCKGEIITAWHRSGVGIDFPKPNICQHHPSIRVTKKNHLALILIISIYHTLVLSRDC